MGTIAWSTLYLNGLVYGDLSPDLIPPFVKTNLGVVAQNKRIVIGEDEFIFRLPRSRKDPLSTSQANLDRGGNEWDIIYAKLFLTRTLTEFNQNKAFRSFSTVVPSTTVVMMADLYTGSNTAILGRILSPNSVSAVDAISNGAWGTNTNYILPVLELVL